MTKPKTTAVTVQVNKLDKYTVPKQNITMDEPRENAGTPVEPSLSSIMAAIQTLGATLEAKIDTVSIEMNLMRADLRKTSDKVQAAEETIEDLRGKTRSMEDRIQKLTHQHKEMALQLDDQEGRARRNNIRVVGVQEGLEGRSVELFLEDLILNHLKPKRLSKIFSVERAHRAPIPKPKPGAPPRTIIARILNFRDRDAILQAARVRGDLQYENTTIRFYPDFTLKVQRERRSFEGIKRVLRENGLKYMMFFPAKLKVIDGGTSRFFTTPEEAQRWLDAGPFTGRRQRFTINNDYSSVSLAVQSSTRRRREHRSLSRSRSSRSTSPSQDPVQKDL